jgi:hypothetical protein
MRFWALLSLVTLVTAIPVEDTRLEKRVEREEVFIGYRVVRKVRRNYYS